MEELPHIDVRIWSALIGGSFVAVGWIVNGIRNRRQKRRQRSERLRDVHRAIFAEIGANLSNLVSVDHIKANADSQIAQMKASASYKPFVVREKHDQVFQAILNEIHILPRTSIDPVVAYYSQLASIERLIDDMRDDTFKRLSARRRIAIYADFMEMNVQAFEYGNHALRMIKIFAEQGPEAAKALEIDLRLNSHPGGGPSDP